MADFSMFKEFPIVTGRALRREGDFESHELLPFPPVNLSEDDYNVYIRALAPGLRQESASIKVTERKVVLEGEVPLPEGHYFRQERFSGPFRRVVKLPGPVRKNEAKISLSDGVLLIVLPKALNNRIIPVYRHPIDRRG